MFHELIVGCFVIFVWLLFIHHFPCEIDDVEQVAEMDFIWITFAAASIIEVDVVLILFAMSVSVVMRLL